IAAARMSLVSGGPKAVPTRKGPLGPAELRPVRCGIAALAGVVGGRTALAAPRFGVAAQVAGPEIAATRIATPQGIGEGALQVFGGRRVLGGARQQVGQA